jgi:hypothetical protein
MVGASRVVRHGATGGTLPASTSRRRYGVGVLILVTLIAVALAGIELCVLFWPPVQYGTVTYSSPAPWPHAVVSVRHNGQDPVVGVAFLLKLHEEWTQTEYAIASSEEFTPRAEGRISGAQGQSITINLGDVYLAGGASREKIEEFVRGYRVTLRAAKEDQLADFRYASADRPTPIEATLMGLRSLLCPRLCPFCSL